MKKIASEMTEWENSNVQVFWGEIAPCDHVVQIYENDQTFLNTLEGFAGSGFIAEDSVVVIATAIHLEELNKRLTHQGFDLSALIARDQYIPLDTKEQLPKFMIDNWADEQLFFKFVDGIISRAKTNNRKVRAFGELVAVLWAQGHSGATVQLEHLWHDLVQKNAFTLYCAYPKIGFTQNANDSIDQICKSHSRVIDGHAGPATEIWYKTAS